MRRMKAFIAFLLLVVLFGIIFPLSFAQQNQSVQKPNPEIETLEKRISELESKLQTVENIEKMELTVKLAEAQAKLADANTKLANADFGKFERELRNANDRWLRDWGLFFLAILAVVGVAFWYALKSLIANGIEKRVDGFKEALAQVDTLKNELKEALGQVDILQDQIRILEKEHAASVLESSVHLPDSRGDLYSETVKALPDGGLLDLIADKTRGLDFRYKAAEVLFVRKNPKLVSPVLELLNSLVNSTINWDDSYDAGRRLRGLVNFLGQVHTQEAYEGLTKFLNRLLTESPKYKDLFLTWTVFSLARISVGLHKEDSVSMLRRTVTNLEVLHYQYDDLKVLVEYFGAFNEPESIKEILTNNLTDNMPDVEDKCLELLQKHDPEFVKEWKAQKETSNTQNEESS